jgi:hypothetical protein
MAILALMWLLFLHSSLARIRCRGLRVDNREGTVPILVQLLVLMTMLFVVPACAVSKRLPCTTLVILKLEAYFRPFWFL